MVLWGGELSGTLLNTGGLYDPVANAWVGPTSLTGAPSPRTLHTLTWTGKWVIVWGGSTGYGDLSTTTYYNEGHRYDPATNKWGTHITTANAPSGRAWHSAVWTGSRMIVWGGYDGTNRVNTGGIYDPVANRWEKAPTTVNAPSPRLHHVACWTGTEMIIWGGNDAGLKDLNDGARYNPATDTWTPISSVGAPLARQAATAVWSGWEMIVWGGSVVSGAFRTSTQEGARYDPGSDTWAAATSLVNAPSPRQGHSAVWTGSKMIVTHGALAGDGYKDDGAIYEPPVLPRGTHPATITVTAVGALNSPAAVSVTMGVTLPAVPTLRITGAVPAPGSALSGSSDSIFLAFNEDLDPASVSPASIRLVRASDGVVLAPSLSLVGTNQVRVDLSGIPVANQDLRLIVSGTPAAFAGRFGHWKLDEGMGATTADASGNGRVGTLDNVQWAEGRVGNGLYFSGGANRVRLNAGTLAPSWSAALWIKREDSPNVESRIMDCLDSDTYGTSLRLEQYNPRDRVGFTTYNIQDYFFDYIAPVNAWTHLTWVGTASGTSLYVNGTLFGVHPASVSLFVANLGSFSINAMKGSMDEVQVYSRALTPAEVLSLARLDGAVRGLSGRVLDGEFGGAFPSGNGSSGGDFGAMY